MSSQPPVRPPRRIPGYGCLLKSLGLFMLICGLGMGGALYLRREQYRRQLAAAVAHVRSAGEPLDGRELNALYNLRDESNDRTALYVHALAPFAEKSSYFADAAAAPVFADRALAVPSVGQDWPEFPKIEQFLADHSSIAAGLHEAGSESGSVRYPANFNAGFEVRLPQVNQVLAAARFLHLEARVRMQRRQYSEAVDSLICGLRMGESLSELPLVYPQYARFAVLDRSVEQLTDVLNIGLAESDLARLQAALADVDFAGSFTRALQGERAVCYHTLIRGDMETLQLLGGRGANQSLNRPRSNQSLADLRPGDCAALLNGFNEVVDASKHPFPKAAVEVELANDRLQQLLANDAQEYPWDRHDVSQALYPIPLHKLTLEHLALQRTALVAVAIQRFRAAQGKLPETIDDLVPELLPNVPVDPCDGQPLRLKLTDRGFIAYSVGPEGVDDQGAVAIDGVKGADIGIAVEVR